MVQKFEPLTAGITFSHVNRRCFLKTCGGVGLLAGTASAVQAMARWTTPGNQAAGIRPNIVFVFADQLRSFDLSCYCGRQIQTPNIDRLAKEGLRLTNAISTYPICSPFRAMLLTGLYPMRNGMTNNDHFLKPDVPSFAEACKAAGYHTGYIGKWHLDGRGREAYIPPERRLGFQHWKALECTHDYFNSKYYASDSDEPLYWEGYDGQAQTRAASRYIHDRAKKGPFALFLSWGPPHDPYIAPKEYMDRIDPSDIEFRPNVYERRAADALMENPRINIPESFKNWRANSRAWLNDEQSLRKATAGYLAAIMALDDYLGDLIKTLKEVGCYDSTILVFTSDHGDHLGSHRFYGKDTPFEESISIPFIVRYPEKIQASSTSDALFSPVDIMPTLLGLAGIACPKVDGRDRSDVMLGAEQDSREAILIMGMTHFCNATVVNGMDTWRGVRTKRYTYARYEDGTPWLLYDNVKDPFQMRNLADDSDHAEMRQTLNGHLDRLLAEAGDPEDTKTIYDIIVRENPKRTILTEFRKANPDSAI